MTLFYREDGYFTGGGSLTRLIRQAQYQFISNEQLGSYLLANKERNHLAKRSLQFATSIH
jgi:hypothetical protein